MGIFELEGGEWQEELGSARAALARSVVHRRAGGGRVGARYAPDGLLDVWLNHQQFELVVEAKRELFHRDVRQQIWQLRDYLDQMDGAGERVAMLIAGAISNGARDILQQESIGYFDLGGSLFIPASGAYVLIDRPQPKKAGRALGSI